MHGWFWKNKNVPFVDTSVVTDMKWGEEGRRRSCFTAPCYYLCDSRPNSHRTTGKSLPKEAGNEWLFILSVHTNVAGTLHTQTESHMSGLSKNSEERRPTTITVGVRMFRGLVHWLDGYRIIQTPNRKDQILQLQQHMKALRDSSRWTHLAQYSKFSLHQHPLIKYTARDVFRFC